MKKHPIYFIFGILVVLAATASELLGWGTDTPDEVRNVPGSVRDNPASYRPTYVYVGRSIRRGK
jgi:hypothetical protein